LDYPWGFSLALYRDRDFLAGSAVALGIERQLQSQLHVKPLGKCVICTVQYDMMLSIINIVAWWASRVGRNDALSSRGLRLFMRRFDARWPSDENTTCVLPPWLYNFNSGVVFRVPPHRTLTLAQQSPGDGGCLSHGTKNRKQARAETFPSHFIQEVRFDVGHQDSFLMYSSVPITNSMNHIYCFVDRLRERVHGDLTRLKSQRQR